MTILTFFTKILSRSAQWRLCFAFTFPCEREAGLNINKVCDFVMNEKNIIFISCVFNGFIVPAIILIQIDVLCKNI